MSRRLDTRYDNITRPDDLSSRGTLAIICAGSTAVLSSMFFILGNEPTSVEQNAVVCNFTTDTKTVEAQPNEGLIGLAVEVDGITEESPCLEEAKRMVVVLNKDTNPNAPAVGQKFVIPEALVQG